MKKNIIYLLLSIAAVLGCIFTSCDDDDTNMSRIVLASADVLEYEALPSGSQIITVTSDADWVAESPAWITVTPASGTAGQTEVEIIVNDNLRDGTPDNPRKGNVLFKGRDLESIATVIVRQGGNKFRDPVDYTIESIASVEDETVVRLPDMTVVALSSKGFIATDGTSFIYVKEPATAVTVGQKVNIVGEKHSDSMHMTYMLGERISDAGTGEMPPLTPFDISSTLDKTEGNVYKYVSVTGDFDGSAITVDGMTNKVYLVDPLDELGLDKLSGHKITLTGFYAGAAAPVVNVIPSAVEDLGLNETVYFNEDFEWLEPWAAFGKDGSRPAADIVGTDQADTEQPQITAATCVIEGKTPAEALADRGYEFIRDCNESKKPGECIYIQRNYLKFGKTGYQGGIILPAMPALGDGAEDVTLAFDWYPQRQGTGVMDPTELVVIVSIDGNETTFGVPPHGLAEGSKAQWVHASIELNGVVLTKEARITIRNVDSQLGSGKALRWHLDNIKVSKPL